MTPPGDAAILELCAAANVAVAACVARTGASGADVVSAYLSLARSAVIVARQLGTPPDVLRAAVEQIWVECGEKERAN